MPKASLRNAITEDSLKITSQQRRSPWKTEVGIRSPQEGKRRQQRRTDKNCSMMTSYQWMENGQAS